MCQKGQVFRQFYAVILTSPSLVKPTALQVFKSVPSELQVSEVINKYVIGKMPPVAPVGAAAYGYGDKPQVHVVPIKIATEVLW
jgi:hypothetical protein